MSKQWEEHKIPLYQLDEFNLQDAFERNSLEIFHANQIRLAEILEEINSLYSGNRVREMMVKIYSVFGELKVIFSRLGLHDLYQQLQLIVNAISKLVVLFEPQQNSQVSKKNSQGMQKADKEVKLDIKQASKQVAKEIKPQRVVDESKKGRPKNLGGVFLYNQSYQKTVEPMQGRKRQQAKQKLKQLEEYIIDKAEQQQKQQMWFYIERKKDLSLINVKDHSKNYKEIENQFKVVEERLIQSLQGLHIQLNHQSIKASQYLSKQQINNELFNFNSSMRSQLKSLIDHYDSAHEQLLKKNKQLTDKLNQELNRKNLLVHNEVQTTDSIGSYKKTKKICEQYEQRIDKLHECIVDLKKNIMRVEQKQKDLLYEIVQKQRCIKSQDQSILKKQKQIEQLHIKCRKYEEIISEISFNQKYQAFSNELNNHLNQNTQTIINLGQDQDIDKKKRKKMLMNKFNSKDRSIKIASRKELASAKKIQQDRLFYQQDQTLENQFQGDDLPSRIQTRKNSILELIQKSKTENEVNEESENYDKLKRTSQKNKRQSRSKLQGKQLNYLSVPIQKKSSFSAMNNRNLGIYQKQRLSKIVSSKGSQLKQRKQSKTLHSQESSPKNKNGIKIKSNFGEQQRNTKSHTTSFNPIIIINSPVQKNAENNVVKMVKKKDSFLVKKGSLHKNPLQSSQNSTGIWNKSSTIKQVEVEDAIDLEMQNYMKQEKQKENVKKSNKLKLVSLASLNKSWQPDQQIAENEIQKQTLVKKQSKDQCCLTTIKSPTQQNEYKPTFHKQSRQKQQLLNHLTTKQKTQLSYISQNLLKSVQLSDTWLKQIVQQCPEILSKLEQPSRKEYILKELNRMHEMKCKQNQCRHLQSFVEFCYKMQESCSKRCAMKLPVQDFSNI